MLVTPKVMGRVGRGGVCVFLLFEFVLVFRCPQLGCVFISGTRGDNEENEGEGKENRSAARDRPVAIQAGHRGLPNESLFALAFARSGNAQS